MKSTSWFTLVAVLLMTVPLAAQDREYRGEVFGLIGTAHMAEDEGGLGNGANYAGGAGWHFSPKYALEFEVNGMNTRESFAGGAVASSNRPVYFTGSIVRKWPGRHVEPFLLFGVGMLHHQSKLVVRIFPDPFDPTVFTEMTLRSSAPGYAWNIGTGLRFFMNDHLAVRTEARFFYGRPPIEPAIFEPPIMVARLSAGLSYVW